MTPITAAMMKITCMLSTFRLPAKSASQTRGLIFASTLKLAKVTCPLSSAGSGPTAGASAAAGCVEGDAGACRGLDNGRCPQHVYGFALWFEFDWYFGLAHVPIFPKPMKRAICGYYAAIAGKCKRAGESGLVGGPLPVAK